MLHAPHAGYIEHSGVNISDETSAGVAHLLLLKLFAMCMLKV